MNNNIFPLSMFDNIKAHPENYRLIERIPLTVNGVDTHFPIKLNEPVEGERVHTVVFLDTETTGMDFEKCKLIELGMVKATFSLDRKIILSVDKYYDEFEDPKEPIPKEIIEITHITDDMVQGHSFDDDMVANFLAGRPLVVAHNAGFDRPFFDKRFGMLNNLSWACSLKEINWSKLGFNGQKLEYLNSCLGYFYDAHRAYTDALALLWILYQKPEAFACLVDSALSKSIKIDIKGNTFSINNELKKLEFRFDSFNKSWYRYVGSKAEAVRLQETIENTYKQGDVNFTVKLTELTAKTRYKK
ncbi:MAG: 3'-5' exonuclease [Succinatimonas hippei]|nr:3'-5' exonuclease [Succinatimonas hippei]